MPTRKRHTAAAGFTAAAGLNAAGFSLASRPTRTFLYLGSMESGLLLLVASTILAPASLAARGGSGGSQVGLGCAHSY